MSKSKKVKYCIPLAQGWPLDNTLVWYPFWFFSCIHMYFSFHLIPWPYSDFPMCPVNIVCVCSSKRRFTVGPELHWLRPLDLNLAESLLFFFFMIPPCWRNWTSYTIKYPTSWIRQEFSWCHLASSSILCISRKLEGSSIRLMVISWTFWARIHQKWCCVPPISLMMLRFFIEFGWWWWSDLAIAKWSPVTLSLQTSHLQNGFYVN